MRSNVSSKLKGTGFRSIENHERHHGHCKITYVQGDPTSYKTLKDLRKRKVDSIVFAGLEDQPADAADAQLISSLIQIQEVANGHWMDKKGFNVVSPVHCSETQFVARQLVKKRKGGMRVPIVLDLISKADLSSGVLVQVEKRTKTSR